MNNFVFGQDPLLYSSIMSRQMPSESDLKQQLDSMFTQYQNQQQQHQVDYLGELDELMKDMGEDVAGILQGDNEFLQLNSSLQAMIQEEMMKSIKWKINSNPEAVKKIDRLKTLIGDAKKAKSAEERQSMAELNDYIKNYSDLTFNEYKQLKQEIKNK